MRVTKDKRRNKALLIGRILIYLLCSILFLLVGLSIGYLLQKRAERKRLWDKDYFPVQQVMSLVGYEETDKDSYHKTIAGIDIDISFDFAAGICNKNAYQFSLENEYEEYNEEYYLSREVIKKIVNYDLTYDDRNEIRAEPIDYLVKDWTEYSSLIAHAGGAVREKDYNGTYTNSLEALIQNYNLGHRVFEFDFCLTTDGELACIHDWKKNGEPDEKVYSREEWLAFKLEGRYTTMMIDTLMDEMLVNPDIFIVMDTKSYKLENDEIRYQFQSIYELAKEKNPELLDHFIPQIYSDEMYDVIMDVYPWKSIVYTTYATDKTGEEIVAFVEEHDNIDVITYAMKDKRFDDDLKERVHSIGKKLYTHTVNTYTSMVEYAGNGVDGFYTDFLLPEDAQVYQRYMNVTYEPTEEELTMLEND